MGSEVQLAKHVTAWLRAEGWDVYEEVSFGYALAADIVAVRKPVVAVIEVKTSMSLAVLGQARRWLRESHLVYVAVPQFVRGSSLDGATWVCKTLGIGLLCVSKNGRVQEHVHPEFRRPRSTKRILESLRPQQQDGTIPAGSTSGPRWTPWKITVTELSEYVRLHPGVTLGEALQKVKHHYSSAKAARASLSHQIRKGIIKTVRAEGRTLKLYPVADPLLTPT